MKVKTMRERLHEAIDLANDEKIIAAFRSTPLEISRSKHLTLVQIQELIKDAEEEMSGTSPAAPSDEELDDLHKTFFAVIRRKKRNNEEASA